jgi:hypothetical protein
MCNKFHLILLQELPWIILLENESMEGLEVEERASSTLVLNEKKVPKL